MPDSEPPSIAPLGELAEQSLLRRDPQYLTALRALDAVAWANPSLALAEKHLICLAAAAAVTDLDAQRIRLHITRALEAGATEPQVVEVIELTSALGVHACTEGLPALLDAIEPLDASPLSPRQRQLEATFVDKRGYWNAVWEGLLRLDEDYFEAYLNFSAHPWATEHLSPAMKELVYVAFDATASHLYRPGIEIHVRNALKLGATPQQVANVFTLLSTLGARTTSIAIRILDDIHFTRSGPEATDV
ncbi:carboxymuconolactone decarboxylase family protein [Nocardia nepalensis]|uniref:carboxymuconolactone decarboxylase family protein n=1 Tax=Nocardia nepalensis TaxID=3375448 RepID=UPI003B67B0AB